MNKQIIENLNAMFKNSLSVDVDTIKFFKEFEKIVEEKWYKELMAEFQCQQKFLRLSSMPSIMLEQLADKYTDQILEMFRK